MANLLGIDVGTTNTKVRIYSEYGRMLGEKKFPTPGYQDDWGPVFKPDKIFLKLQQTISSFEESVKKDVRALSVSSIAETIIGIDGKGKPCTTCILWFDRRTKAQFRRTAEHLNAEEIYAVTGLMPHHIYSFYKLLWLKENQEENFNRALYWTSMSGYILFAFCGELSFDYSLASRTMLFHQRRKCWWEEMTRLTEVPVEKMAKAVPSGQILGKIKREIAEAIGINSSALVVTGGHDHLCAALAAGVFKKGSAIITTGTTESLTM
ncbi:MAG: FGGY family carbohydrate kinase, partial [Spirochaetota bacterium]